MSIHRSHTIMYATFPVRSQRKGHVGIKCSSRHESGKGRDVSNWAIIEAEIPKFRTELSSFYYRSFGDVTAIRWLEPKSRSPASFRRHPFFFLGGGAGRSAVSEFGVGAVWMDVGNPPEVSTAYEHTRVNDHWFVSITMYEKVQMVHTNSSACWLCAVII